MPAFQLCKPAYVIVSGNTFVLIQVASQTFANSEERRQLRPELRPASPGGTRMVLVSNGLSQRIGDRCRAAARQEKFAVARPVTKPTDAVID